MLCTSRAYAEYPRYNGVGTLGPLAWIEQLNVPYATTPSSGLSLSTNICKPVPSPSTWAGPYPAVLLIHGGSWVGGSHAINGDFHNLSAPNWCQLWASWGFVAYAIEYPLYNSAPGLETFGQLASAQTAVRWVRSRAYGSNPDRVNPAQIGAMGEEVGGELALNLGAMSYALDDPDGFSKLNPSANPKVQFVVAQNAAFHSSAPVANGTNLKVIQFAPIYAVSQAEPGSGSKSPPANSLFLRLGRESLGPEIEVASGYCYIKGHNNPTNYLSFNPDPWEGDDFLKKTVGYFITRAISFAVDAGHYAPPGSSPAIPLSFRGPG